MCLREEEGSGRQPLVSSPGDVDVLRVLPDSMEDKEEESSDSEGKRRMPLRLNRIKRVNAKPITIPASRLKSRVVVWLALFLFKRLPSICSVFTSLELIYLILSISRPGQDEESAQLDFNKRRTPIRSAVAEKCDALSEGALDRRGVC